MSVFSCHFNFYRWLQWLYYIPWNENNDFRSLLLICLNCLLLFATVNNVRRIISLYLSPYLCLFFPHFSFPAEGFKYFKVSYTDTFAFQKSRSKFSVWDLNIFLSNEISEATLDLTFQLSVMMIYWQNIGGSEEHPRWPHITSASCLKTVAKVSLWSSVLFALYIFYKVPQCES